LNTEEITSDNEQSPLHSEQITEEITSDNEQKPLHSEQITEETTVHSESNINSNETTELPVESDQRIVTEEINEPVEDTSVCINREKTFRIGDRRRSPEEKIQMKHFFFISN